MRVLMPLFALGGAFLLVQGQEYTASIDSKGCYSDSPARSLTGRRIVTQQSMNSPQYCANFCGLMGYKYSAVEYGVECYCGNQLENDAKQLDNGRCNFGCPADGSKKCGGVYTMNLVEISNPKKSNGNSAFPLTCENAPFKSTGVCNEARSIEQRAAALVKSMTLDEKIQNLVHGSAGSVRLGILPVDWWNEALHGVAGPPFSPGVSFSPQNGGPFSSATSFPMPINLGASFDDELVAAVAGIIGKEARAFSNAGNAGFDYWTPNINPFRDPRWGRGSETPGEDSFHIQSYVSKLVPALQGPDPLKKQIIATCKHFAAYDIENGRYSNDVHPSQQDMGEYYLPPFKSCIRDAKAGSTMCAYNAVNGVPACASDYLLTTLLREHYNFSQPYHYVVSDCEAIDYIFTKHHYTNSLSSAAAVALNAGTDLNCGTTFLSLKEAIEAGETTEAKVDKALTRIIAGMFTVGYFDGQSPYNKLGWADINTNEAQDLAYQAAVKGMTLLMNDGLLPVTTNNYPTVALIGPYVNATNQLQGNYYGVAPSVSSPFSAAYDIFTKVVSAKGTDIDSSDNSGFAAAIAAAKQADLVIYLGGIDIGQEAEAKDRTSIGWPGNQLDLIKQLSHLRKKFVVVQFGGGQLDDSDLLDNRGVNALIWAGYPGQAGGKAIMDVISGAASPAGRLPITQYPSSYADAVDPLDMSMRPNGNFPGRTYKWYNEEPVLPFGHGLHYTKFTAKWTNKPDGVYQIDSLINAAKGAQFIDAYKFETVSITVKNAGKKYSSDYAALLFLKGDAGPEPRPNKSLVSYQRADSVAPGQSQELSFPLTLSSIARADEYGDLWIYPGKYILELDNDARVKVSFTLEGREARIEVLPRT
ncbi:glycoside hydrolase superfamily [Dactylonectria macrodidyma]|uniref:xylan 1,4-beta-xylosidase n=1 Tax=Dactylonectria macrodidyma TaxID=307937 RepID=A0A9P9FTU8_9HYPO|nr:glycoside hydrolase superfamily [Dactylonectria macrodidyma]